MASYLDINGLGYFKEKMDDANDAKFIKNTSLDEVIKNKLTGVYRYKGTVASADLLPQVGNEVGDVYDVNNGMNYAWNGNRWDELGEGFGAIDANLSETSTNPVQNKVVKEALDKKAGTSVASESSNGLMSAEDKQKLNGIAKNANKYELPESPAGAKTLDLYKIATNANGMVENAVKVTKTDITSLGIPAANTDTTYEPFTRAVDGLVPHPTTSTTTRYLREDGKWEIPPDNNTTYAAITNTEIDNLFT